MKPLSPDEAVRQYPHLVKLVLDKLGQTQTGDVDPKVVTWHALACHDDPDQPLDEAACADIMLTGSMLCQNGLCGSIDGHFACYCDKGCEPADVLRNGGCGSAR
jgi:hypothetical protein